jgi:tetratricopeptide (TPR) repeat protein
MHAATALGRLGRYAEEADNLNQALSLFRQAGDQRGEGLCLNNLGAVLEDRGMHRDAVDHYERSIVVFQVPITAERRKWPTEAAAYDIRIVPSNHPKEDTCLGT